MTPDMRSAMAGARLPRTAIALAASLLLGFALGSAIAGLSMVRTAARVADTDLVLMVADLYEHEKSVFNARERLLQVGRSPVELAEAASEGYAREHPEARRDVDALRQLATALRQSEGDLAARPGVPIGTVAVGLLIAVSIALGAGAAWLWKRAETGAVRLPYLGRPSGQDGDASTEDGTPRRFGKLATRLATTVGRGRTVPDAAPRPEGTRPRGGRADAETIDEPPRPRRSAEAVSPTHGAAPHPQAGTWYPAEGPGTRPEDPVPGRRTGGGYPAPGARHPARLLFESYYSLGEDPYDSIHPIHDARGELLGACGLSATEPSDRPGRYYGFTAWLQDYAAGSELSAVGLVTRAGQIARAAAVNEWLRRGTIDGVLPIERGTDHRLATPNATLRITVVDVDYAPPSPGSPGYFGRLTVRFELL